MKTVSILGSTGSIGMQALEVISANSELLKVGAISAKCNAGELVAQAIKYKPAVVAIYDNSYYAEVRDALAAYGVEVLCGMEGLMRAATMDEADVVLTAVVGAIGLQPTLAAIRAGKDIALANKETLVVAGELVMREAEANGVQILPVDSEHSAIFQCLAGEPDGSVEKLLLTASGGPFRGYTAEMLAGVTKKEALKHPNWVMGAKITIDSASLMNKGLEVIEASHLFKVRGEAIDVLVHPQSIIHSMVQFTDGSIKAQLGVPDMKLPIHYAFNYPNRVNNSYERLDLTGAAALEFYKPDVKSFKNLDLAYNALAGGGNSCAVLNAANEVVVEAFLNERISFLGMSAVIETCLERMNYIQNPTLEDYLQTDMETRKLAAEMI